MSGLGNAGASTSGNPGDGSSATQSDPTQTSEGAHVRSYVPKIEHLIEKYRMGEQTRFELVSTITRFLSEDSDLSTCERAQSFDLYLMEIDAIGKDIHDKGKRTEGPEPAGVKQLSHYAAIGGQGHDNGGSSRGYSSSSSESDDERDRKRRKLRQSDMPWHGH